MAILTGQQARQIIGVDFAVTWTGVAEMVATMEGPPGLNHDHINADVVKRFKDVVRDPIVGDKVRKLAQSLTDRVPEMRKRERKTRRIWDDSDGDLSIERYLNDEERYWRRLKRERRPARTIRLMGEISATGWSSDRDIQARCATIVALAQWLVDAGYEVEVLAADFSYGFLKGTSYNKSYQQGTELGTVIVKPASDILDVDNLAAVLCKQDFGYDILLKAIVRACPLPVNGLWGAVDNIPEPILKALDVDVSVPRRIESEYMAAEWLRLQVERLSTHHDEEGGQDG